MDFQTLIIEKQNTIAWVTLNRPDVMNALNQQLVTEIISAVQSLEDDESVNVIVLKGAGRSFCAGADLKDESWLGKGVLKDRLATYGPWHALEEASKPTIAAVHGYAITGGYLLAAACDIVIASEDASFADTHSKWGLIPYGGEPQRLLKLVGVRKAKELMFTGKMITAVEAERYGLINTVVPRDQLEKAAHEMAEVIAQNSQHSVRAIKRMINFGIEFGYASGMRLEEIIGKRGMVNTEPDEERERRLSGFKKG
ncbi:enoyl-CoA hydratase/isomerase family protein [Thermodesulfobacteriota bacterium]